MSTVFITGDRQFTPLYPTQVTVEVVRALGAGNTVVTGTLNGGVEQLVRDLMNAADVVPGVVEHSVLDNGKPDFYKYAQSVIALGDLKEIVVIHSDPHTSSVAKAFLDNASAIVRLATPADLLP